MTKILILSFLLVGQFVLGQNSDSISKIIIEYDKSHSSWGNPGVYGVGEIIELLPIPNGDYKFTRFMKTIASAGKDGKTFQKDSIDLITKASRIVAKEKIRFWLIQLNINKDNVNSSFLVPRLKAPTRREIFQIAKKYKLLWMLKGVDSDRTDTKKAINQIQNYYKLDSFIIFQKPCNDYELVVTDSYNRLTIQTISDKDTTEYQCSFYVPLGQPIFRYDKRNYIEGKRVCNL